MNFWEHWNDVGTNHERLVRKKITRFNTTILWYWQKPIKTSALDNSYPAQKMPLRNM